VTNLKPSAKTNFIMKSIVLLVALLASAIPSRAAEAAGYKSESQALSEIFTSTITKVYSVRDGDYRFVAYAVAWRNQEVIVTPFSPQHEDLTVGEVVRCEMRQIHPSVGGAGKGRMTFSLLGRPGEPSAIGVRPSPVEEQARLEAVAAEVSRRRADREAAGSKMEPNPSKPNKAP
jgi:hypothetical protein